MSTPLNIRIFAPLLRLSDLAKQATTSGDLLSSVLPSDDLQIEHKDGVEYWHDDESDHGGERKTADLGVTEGLP